MNNGLIVAQVLIALGMIGSFGFFGYALRLKLKLKDSAPLLFGFGSVGAVIAYLCVAVIIIEGGIDMSTAVGEAKLRLLMMIAAMALTFSFIAVLYLRKGNERSAGN